MTLNRHMPKWLFIALFILVFGVGVGAWVRWIQFVYGSGFLASTIRCGDGRNAALLVDCGWLDGTALCLVEEQGAVLSVNFVGMVARYEEIHCYNVVFSQDRCIVCFQMDYPGWQVKAFSNIVDCCDGTVYKSFIGKDDRAKRYQVSYEGTLGELLDRHGGVGKILDPRQLEWRPIGDPFSARRLTKDLLPRQFGKKWGPFLWNPGSFKLTDLPAPVQGPEPGPK